jgi:hypothetical protein
VNSCLQSPLTGLGGSVGSRNQSSSRTSQISPPGPRNVGWRQEYHFTERVQGMLKATEIQLLQRSRRCQPAAQRCPQQRKYDQCDRQKDQYRERSGHGLHLNPNSIANHRITKRLLDFVAKPHSMLKSVVRPFRRYFWAVNTLDVISGSASFPRTETLLVPWRFEILLTSRGRHKNHVRCRAQRKSDCNLIGQGSPSILFEHCLTESSPLKAIAKRLGSDPVP